MKRNLVFGLLFGFITMTVFAEGHISYQETQGGRSPFYVNSSTKRLNTADCNDADDWYLDGFRVGKNYSSYHQSLLQQRISYCQQYGGVSNGLKSAWMQGYKKGAPVQKKSKKKRKKRAHA